MNYIEDENGKCMPVDGEAMWFDKSVLCVNGSRAPLKFNQPGFLVGPEPGAVEFYDGETYVSLPSGKRETLEKAINEAPALHQVIDNQDRELMAWRSRFPEYAYDAQSGIISYRAFPNKEEDI